MIEVQVLAQVGTTPHPFRGSGVEGGGGWGVLARVRVCLRVVPTPRPSPGRSTRGRSGACVVAHREPRVADDQCVVVGDAEVCWSEGPVAFSRASCARLARKIPWRTAL